MSMSKEIIIKYLYLIDFELFFKVVFNFVQFFLSR